MKRNEIFNFACHLFSADSADLENNGIDQKTETIRTKICKNASTMDSGAPLKFFICSLKGDITPKQKSPKMSRNPH